MSLICGKIALGQHDQPGYDLSLFSHVQHYTSSILLAENLSATLVLAKKWPRNRIHQTLHFSSLPMDHYPLPHSYLLAMPQQWHFYMPPQVPTFCKGSSTRTSTLLHTEKAGSYILVPWTTMTGFINCLINNNR